MFCGPISIFIGDVIDGSAPGLEAVGNIQEDAKAMTEVPGIVVHKFSCGDVGELNIQVGKVRLICWEKNTIDDNSINCRLWNFHFTVKKLENGCSHGCRIIRDGMLIFQVLDVDSSDRREANDFLGRADNRC